MRTGWRWIGDWSATAYTFTTRKDREPHQMLQVISPSGRVVDVTESPTGRTVHVWVDGRRWVPEQVTS